MILIILCLLPSKVFKFHFESYSFILLYLSFLLTTFSVPFYFLSLSLYKSVINLLIIYSVYPLIYPIRLLNIYHVLKIMQVIKNPELSGMESTPEARKKRKNKTLWLHWSQVALSLNFNSLLNFTLTSLYSISVLKI